jgi:tRNA-specific 2-thiouridylase
MKKEKVLLGMSGGTDSSVAAIMLTEKGFEVIGLTFRFWTDTDRVENREIPEYIEKAVGLAESLGIEHHVVDVRQEFYDEIVQFVLHGYMQGITPNPCTKCNPKLKWKLLLDYANSFGCRYLSTGHYVETVWQNNQQYILKGKDPEKEQSFFLWGLSKEMLNRCMFPLGGLKKDEVRAYAKSRGYGQVASTKESIGICFLQDGKYQPFLEKTIGKDGLPGEGDFVDRDGVVLGKHKGFPYYTVGQRRGLGLVPKEPLFVLEIRAKDNVVVLGKRDELYKKKMIVKDVVVADNVLFKQEVIARIRYRKQAAPSTVNFLADNTVEVVFVGKEWSIAPGQAAAFYDGDRLIGGGIIEEAF